MSYIDYYKDQSKSLFPYFLWVCYDIKSEKYEFLNRVCIAHVTMAISYDEAVEQIEKAYEGKSNCFNVKVSTPYDMENNRTVYRMFSGNNLDLSGLTDKEVVNLIK